VQCIGANITVIFNSYIRDIFHLTVFVLGGISTSIPTFDNYTNNVYFSIAQEMEGY
jgi:hypothetical protein